MIWANQYMLSTCAIAALSFDALNTMIFTKKSGYELIHVIMSVTLFVNIIKYIHMRMITVL